MTYRDLKDRFEKVLDDPILQAMGAFDHRKWPESKGILASSLNDEIVLLYQTYKGFFDTSTETEEMVLEQWGELKEEIRKETGLTSRKFHDLWPHMLIHFSDEYNLILRLVAISLLVPTDTSECERVFSLMNDLKTAGRSSLRQASLKNLMVWHSFAHDLSCEKLPVMAILKEFRELSGVKGRDAHRVAQLHPSTSTALRLRGAELPAIIGIAHHHKSESKYAVHTCVSAVHTCVSIASESYLRVVLLHCNSF